MPVSPGLYGWRLIPHLGKRLYSLIFFLMYIILVFNVELVWQETCCCYCIISCELRFPGMKAYDADIG